MFLHRKNAKTPSETSEVKRGRRLRKRTTVRANEEAQRTGNRGGPKKKVRTPKRKGRRHDAARTLPSSLASSSFTTKVNDYVFGDIRDSERVEGSHAKEHLVATWNEEQFN